MESKLFFDGGKREEHELAQVGQGVGGAGGHAVLRDGGENFAENIVDVGGSEKVAGEGGGEFAAKLSRFEELLLLLRVKDAQGSVGGGAREAAAAAIGGLEGAAIEIGVLLAEAFFEGSLTGIFMGDS